MKHRLLYLILLYSISSIYGQVKDSTSFYLDDGNISTSKQIVKASVSELIHGLADLRYEYIISDKFSLELAGGFKLPYYTPYLAHVDHTTSALDSEKEGYPYGGNKYADAIRNVGGKHFSIMPRYYITHRAPESFYIGLQYRHQKFNENDYYIKADTYSFHAGLQSSTKSRFMLDCSMMVVGIINHQYIYTEGIVDIVNNEYTHVVERVESETGMIFTLELKVGYKL